VVSIFWKVQIQEKEAMMSDNIERLTPIVARDELKLMELKERKDQFSLIHNILVEFLRWIMLIAFICIISSIISLPFIIFFPFIWKASVFMLIFSILALLLAGALVGVTGRWKTELQIREIRKQLSTNRQLLEFLIKLEDKKNAST
jgi:hypothetical protein